MLVAKAPCMTCDDSKCEKDFISTTTAELIQLSDGHCPGCGLLLDAITKPGIDLSVSDEEMYIASREFEDVYVLHKIYRGNNADDGGEVEGLTLPNDSACFPALASASDVSGSTGIAASLANVIKRMDSCSQGHFEGAVCRKNLDVPLPSLLVRVGTKAADQV